jgi:hypothetical protein
MNTDSAILRRTLLLRARQPTGFRHSLVAALILGLGLAGTLPVFPDDTPKPPVSHADAIRKAGRHLDEIEKQLTEWGHASISGFVLIPHDATAPTGPFQLDHQEPMSNYVARIRTNNQGRAGFLNQRSLSADFTGTISNTGIPADETSPTNRLRNAPAPHVETNLSSADYGRLLAQASSQTALSETTVLKLAATAKETERTLAFMGHPVSLPGNKQAFFGVATVGVFPGWRTREDYICEVSAHFLPSMGREDFVRLAQRRAPQLLLRFGPSDLLAPHLLGKKLLNHSTGVPQLLIQRLRDATKVSMPALLSFNPLSVTPPAPEVENARMALVQDLNTLLSGNCIWNATDFAAVQLRPSTLELLHGQPTGTERMRLNRLLLEDAFPEEIRRHELQPGSNLPRTILGNSEYASAIGLRPRTLSLVSAFPLVESQVFDLQTTDQYRLNLLLNLAGTYANAGYKAELDLVARFMRNIQKDLATRQSLPLIVPGVDANTLTYRFDPEASAMLEPTDRRPRPGRQLLPTSIPVLVLVIADREDLQDWTRLTIQVETRWVPRMKRNPWTKTFVDFPGNFRSKDKRMSHEEALEMVARFDAAVDCLTHPSLRDREAGMELHRRVSVLQTLGFGRTVTSDFPRPSPTLTSFSPRRIAAAESPVFLLLGRNLAPPSTLVTTASLGGVPLRILESRSDRLRMTFESGDGTSTGPLEPGHHDLLVTTADGTIHLPRAVQIEPAARPSPRCEFIANTLTRQRPPLSAVPAGLTPSHAFFNGRTVVTLLGEGFKASDFHDPVTWISVGGRLAENIVVVNDHMLRFEVPAWTDRTELAHSPFPDEAHAADVVLATACQSLVLRGALTFDRQAPRNPPTPSPKPELDAALVEKVQAMMALQKALQKDAVLKGGASVSVGDIDPCCTNGVSSSPNPRTVIQVENVTKHLEAPKE